MTTNTQPCVVIVDAISTASMLSSRLKTRGFQTVHVMSTPNPYPNLANSYRPEDHIAELVFDGDIAACVAEVWKFRPVAVLAGHDPAVELADALSEALGLPTNGTALSIARNKKFAMQEVLRKAGLRYIPSCIVDSWETLQAHFDSGELKLPVVIKPDASGGSDMVIQCHSMEVLQKTLEKILGENNMFGNKNESAIVQPFITGIEYCVDTASCGGRHIFTDIWRMDKIVGNSFIDDRAELLSWDETSKEVCDYIEAMLDAFGIKYGAGYSSILVDEEGPILIEMGARLCGQNPTLMTEAALGISQLSATLDSYVNPTKFFERSKTYGMVKRASLISLISPRSGTLKRLPRMEDLTKLESYFHHHSFMTEGTHIDATTNLRTSPGYVVLLHSDPDVVNRDYATLRQWESEDFYLYE